MGTISLSQYFSLSDLDNWKIIEVQAYDKPAAELNFIDVRHSYCLLTLQNNEVKSKSCGQRLIDCFFYVKQCLGCCVSCCTCCCCCSCCFDCKKSTQLQEVMLEQKIIVLIELTGSATKGAFLSQQLKQYNKSRKRIQLKDLSDCPNYDQLICKAKIEKQIKYGDLRKHLIQQFQSTKYDIRSNNCFHFVITAFEFCNSQTNLLKERLSIIQNNVRSHNILVPALQTIVPL